MTSALNEPEVRIASLNDVLDNKDQRIDSSFWTKEPFRNPDLEYEPIGHHLRLSQYGISISMNEDGLGTPIYRMNEIHNMLCDLNVDKCAQVSSKEVEQYTLSPRDVLFNRTNSYEWVGRMGLYMDCLDGDPVFASYLVRFRTNEDSLLPETLVAFLNCKYGVAEVKRRSRQSINQTNVNPEEVKHILIPLLCMQLQERIAELFERGYRCLEDANRMMERAENQLLAELGLANWSPPEPLTFTASASQVSIANRIDAQYFRPLFSEIDNRLRETGRAVDLGTILTTNARGRQPHYSEEGLPVINSKHVRTNRVLFENNRSALEDGSPVVIQRNDVLINGTGVGTIGRVAPFLHDVDALPDNHVTVLRTDRVDSVYMSVFLNSPLGQMQIERHIKGSSGQLELYPSDIAQVRIWDAPEDVQKSVRDSVMSAFEQERSSIELLEAARRVVEIAIENGEAAAFAYLDKLG